MCKMINEIITIKVKFKDNINKIKLNRGNLLEDAFSICNEFNTFFVNISKNIENNILQRKYGELSWDTQNVNCYNNKYLFFNPICKEKIEKYINKINDHTSYFENNISNCILKSAINNISNPLMIVFNISLHTNIYTSSIKKCNVIPIFKTGSKLCCDNYKPILLSLKLSKILEKCIKSWLIRYFYYCNYFSKNQFGFLQGKSTTDTHYIVNNYIHENLDANRKVMGIFLNVKKAFNSVNHEIL